MIIIIWIPISLSAVLLGYVIFILIEGKTIRKIKLANNKSDEVSDDLDELDYEESSDSGLKVRYNYSLEARIHQAPRESIARFDELKNYILSFPKISVLKSWKYESFIYKEKTIIKITLNGQVMKVYFNLEPDQFLYSKYNIKYDKSKEHKSTPAMLRVKGGTGVEYAKELVYMVMKKLGLKEGKLQKESYALPYLDKDTLIEKGLILVNDKKEQVNNQKLKIQDETLLKEMSPKKPEPIEDVVVKEVLETPQEIVEPPIEEVVQEEVLEAPQDFVEPVEEVIVKKPVEVTPILETQIVQAKSVGKQPKPRYNYSMAARLHQAPQESIERYAAIKNHILSYPGVKASKIWRFENFKYERKTIIKVTLNGQTMRVYFKLDPEKFVDTKYNVNHETSKSHAATPAMLRVRGSRGVLHAKQLVSMLMEELGIPQGEVPTNSYSIPYMELEELVEEGLVKVTYPKK